MEIARGTNWAVSKETQRGVLITRKGFLGWGWSRELLCEQECYCDPGKEVPEEKRHYYYEMKRLL